MRIVSLLVVFLSILWLLAGSQGVRVSDMDLFGVASDSVSGTLADEGDDADEPAVAEIEYRDIYPLLASVDASGELDRISSVTVMQSRLDVPPSDIRLTLLHEGQREDIAVGQDGVVIIPARIEWRDGNAVLRSNQPADSLTMSVNFTLKPFPGTEVEYAWLFESMEQLERALHRMDDATGAPVRYVAGLLLQFPEGKEWSARYVGSRGVQALEADADGALRVPRNPDLLALNPTLELDASPARLLPMIVRPEEQP